MMPTRPGAENYDRLPKEKFNDVPDHAVALTGRSKRMHIVGTCVRLTRALRRAPSATAIRADP